MKPCLKVAIASSKTPARCESRACENHRRHGTSAGGYSDPSGSPNEAQDGYCND
jgi:hypothetical protein